MRFGVLSGNGIENCRPTRVDLVDCQVVNRDQLLSEVWNDNESNSNIVDVYIRRLRLKLEEDVESPKHITSVRGIGYKFLGK